MILRLILAMSAATFAVNTTFGQSHTYSINYSLGFPTNFNLSALPSQPPTGTTFSYYRVSAPFANLTGGFTNVLDSSMSLGNGSNTSFYASQFSNYGHRPAGPGALGPGFGTLKWMNSLNSTYTAGSPLTLNFTPASNSYLNNGTITVQLSNFVPPPQPAATNIGFFTSFNSSATTQLNVTTPGQVGWYTFSTYTFIEKFHLLFSPAGGKSFGLYNTIGELITSSNGNLNNYSLPNGSYYLAVGFGPMTFGNDFAVTNTSTTTGPINFITFVPEPATIGFASLAFVALLRRRPWAAFRNCRGQQSGLA